MKILTGEQMAHWDKLSIQKHRISAQKLMERAARQCCEALQRLPRWIYQAKIVIACGPGNNGGDGLAMAGMLSEKGVSVRAFLFGDPTRLSPEAEYFFRNAGEAVSVVTAKSFPQFAAAVKGADFLVDALFGIGLKRPLKGLHRKAVAVLNRASGFRFAVDIPSGISATSGEILGAAFRADLTVTFECPKWGQLMPSAWDYVGRLEIVPIGLAAGELKRLPSEGSYLTEAQVKKNFRRRPLGVNKGGAGKVLVLAGSANMPGAGYLTALAGLRAGAGLVTWALPEEAFHRLDLRYPEVILDPLPSLGGRFHADGLPDVARILPRFDAVALGPGWGQGDGLADFLGGVLARIKKPRVIDADALNLLSRNPRLLKKTKGAVFTPHPKEMSRLLGRPIAEIEQDRIGTAKRFAKAFGVWLVLKGYRTVIAGPKGQVFLNSTGGPELATAGSGDVLTGILASLLAQGLSPERAVTSGVYLHGAAGDRIARRTGDRGALASEIAAAVPEIVREWLR